jgi:adenylate cyclase
MMTSNMSRRAAVLTAALAIPLIGLALLIAVPELDPRWQHDPTHFWLVLGVALLNVVLGLATSEAARQRDDSRLFLVSMALLSSAGFLGLHALATPGRRSVRTGTQASSSRRPWGCSSLAAFAAASALEMSDEAATTLLRWQRGLRLAVVGILAVWATVSIAEVAPLGGPPPESPPRWFLAIVPFGIAAFAFAAWRYALVFRQRRRMLPLAVAVAFVLLGEALAAVAVGRSWHVSWWEWHVLMAAAFGIILIATRAEYRAERSVTGAFGGLYLQRTLERVDARHAAALGELSVALERGDPDEARRRLLAAGFSGGELAVLERSARELARVDSLLARYVGPRFAEGLRHRPELAELGGVERDASVLFADMVGFTPFTEERPASEVIEMLNRYWEEIVPIVVEREGGHIERFAGDAILALFNALEEQSDHALRAVLAATAIVEASERMRATRDDWPRFRVGVNTGRVVIGNVGGALQQSFSVVGDAVNVAARLQTVAPPGRIALRSATVSAVRASVDVQPIGPIVLKGKEDPIEVSLVVSPLLKG